MDFKGYLHICLYDIYLVCVEEKHEKEGGGEREQQ